MTLRPAPAAVLGGILQPVQDQAAQDPKGRALIGSLPSSSHALQKGQLVCSSHGTHCQVVQAQVHAHAAVRPREAGLHAALLQISVQTQPWGVCAIVGSCEASLHAFSGLSVCLWQHRCMYTLLYASRKQACMQPWLRTCCIAHGDAVNAVCCCESSGSKPACRHGLLPQ